VHEILQQVVLAMSWSTKQKAFCVEAYFINNSYRSSTS